MSDQFDPYHKWLGIPPKDQPPNHYRLLGVELGEADLDVIENAADQRMRHVRTYQAGPHGERSQRLLNELSAAKICLLNRAQKAAYDATLVQAAPAPAAAPPSMTPADGQVVVPTFTAPSPFAGGQFAGGQSPPLNPGKFKARTKPAKDMRVEIAKHVAASLAGLALAYLLLGFLKPEWDGLGVAAAARSLVAGTPTDDNPVKVQRPEERQRNVPSIDPTPPERVRRGGSLANPPAAPRRNGRSSRGNTPPSEKPEVVPSALQRKVTTRNHTWDGIIPNLAVGPANLSFIGLASVSGEFLGNGEWFAMTTDADKHWILTAGGVKSINMGATRVETPMRWMFEDAVQEFQWTKGLPPIKLIHKDYGFAVLSGANGCFLGPQHWVRVYLDPDGFWYLHGSTDIDTRGKALIYRYRRPREFSAEVTEHTWSPGANGRELLHQAEGFCFISHIHGAYRGPGEALSCEINSSTGRWMLRGKSQASEHLGSCIAIKFAPSALVAAAQLSPPALPTPSNVAAAVPMTQGASMPPDSAALEAAGTSLTTSGSLAAHPAALVAAARENRPAAEKYVLLTTALEKATAGGEPRPAFAAIDLLSSLFGEDRALRLSQTLILLRESCQSIGSARDLAFAALQELDQLGPSGASEAVAPLAEAALAGARRSQDIDLMRRSTLKVLDARKTP